MTPSFRYLLLLAALALPSAGNAAPSARPARGMCVAGEPEPSDTRQLRPMPRALCDYDAAELRRRLFGLLGLRADTISIEAVERIFGLSPVATLFDSEQSADYAVEFSGPGEKAEWRVRLDYSEGFFPMLPSRPKRFRGSLHPVRIHPGERGDVRLSLMLPRASPGEAACIPPDALTRAARPRWKDELRTDLVMDGGPHERLSLTRGKLELSVDVTADTACLGELTLTAPADPPVPPITAEEEEGMRRRSAEIAADAVVAGLGKGGDPDSRRAYGAFYRDMSAGSFAGAPDPVGARIDSLDTAQLRDLLKRVAGGSAWGLAREDCEAAIGEPDAPATLLLRARRRGLDEVEVKALQTYCTIYLQGRTYRPPEPAR